MLERNHSRQQSLGHVGNSAASYTSMPLHNGHSMSTSITQGPPDLAAVAAAAAAADSRSVISSKIASNTQLENIPRPLLASPSKKSSALESTASINNFADAKPYLSDAKLSPKAATKLSDVEIEVDHAQPQGRACCLFPLCFKK